MDIVPILSAIILISTLITLVVAIASYMTFRIKEKRKQAAMAEFSEVFSADLAALQDTQPPPTAASWSESEGTATAPVEVVTTQPPAVITPPGVITPPVVVAAPVQMMAPQMQALQPYPQMAQQPAPGMMPQQQGYPPQAMPPQQVDPYSQQQYQPQAPPQQQYSDAQAAFLKGFDVPPPPPQAPGQSPQGADYGQSAGMRRFTVPEKKPRQEPPRDFGGGGDAPAWK
jgi:hypothetical protein